MSRSSDDNSPPQDDGRSVDKTVRQEAPGQSGDHHAVTMDMSVGSSPGKVVHRFPKIDGYQILSVLGQGGMGIVYRATQVKLGRTVALKILPAMMGTASPSAVTRFRREATAAARLHHTNIIPIYDFGESPDAWYYAMELISGQPLNVILQRLPKNSVVSSTPAFLDTCIRDALEPSDDGVAVDQARPEESMDSSASLSSSPSNLSSSGRGRPYFQMIARWMADSADALHYAHGQGIIHRDIKPSNLILAVDGRIMLADFGLAKDVSEASVTMTGSLLGTLRYISPEQAMAKRMRVDHRTDVYSLGATMYEFLAFQPAYTGEDEKEILGAIITRDPAPPRKLNPAVPSELETICMKALEKSPDARYDTARALAEDLRRFMHDMPITAKRPNVVQRAFKFTRRRRALVIGITATILLSISIPFGIRETGRRRAAEIQRLCASGLLYHQEEEFALATQKFTEALERDPDNVEALMAFARTKKEQYNSVHGGGKPETLVEAEALCRKARKLNPANLSALNLHSVILKKLKRYDEAIEVCQTLISSQGAITNEDEKVNYAAALANLGMTYALAGQLDIAEANLRKGAETMGLKHGVYSTAAWRNLAALEHFRDQPEAMTHVQQALEATPRDAAGWVLKARIGLDTDDRTALMDALDDAKHAERTAAGTRPEAKRILALAFLRGGEFDRAISAAERAIEMGDMRCANELIRADALAAKGDREAASVSLTAAIQHWPKRFSSDTDWYATAEAGDLWFESAAELLALKRTAENRLGNKPASDP